ncbi:MAG: recombinase family protein, partial [Crenarchaeota archaeon]|nr:recombinase family protein [Thermoproteota archaeon]
RKSSEEGLELEYNSLDNQYDSCRKYIESQQHEGWSLINKRYDDGGFSGGNLERPALKQLMQDIQNNQIDMVVVYKIDRLSRSLMDFSRLIEVFDNNKTSFISVTQNFNTNDSMGKLMLNILLSFAQFEREMTGDRIRDKIRMQKSKGMWTGGTPPLGYDIIDKKLIINETEAKQVKLIFNTFIETQSIGETLNILKRSEIKTKTYTSKTDRVQGGNEFNRGTLYKMLKNKLYIGLIENKNTNQIYDGLHEKIIPEADFNRVQDLFSKNLNEKIYDKKPDKTGFKFIYVPKKDTNIPYLLKGLMKCECCNSTLTPTYTTKKSGQVYRYYKPNKAIKHSIKTETGKECQLSSIKADDIENIILNQIYGIIRTPTIVSKIIDKVKLKQKQNQVNKSKNETLPKTNTQPSTLNLQQLTLTE